MLGKMTVLKADGSVEVHEIMKHGRFEWLTEAIGGPYQIVPYFETFNGEPCLAFCHEEGKLLGLPINVLANGLWTLFPNYDFLVGPVVIVQGDKAFMRGM
ncbi:DUF3846 domain-containing protein [Sinorhizobium fredii]|uniref:DUF3846 domain-containing protein n=1 Tax=Rhizobium fredii TaxID=380 RepID=UPI001296E168|nr:DUF3846 domain-containing protein [Sinorhizobium fredii]MQW94090.1 DUF3846 domain-containing protein [Sinorhizobium fredii]